MSVPSDRLDALRAALRGTLLLPGDSGYDEARAVWNAMIDCRPAAIVRAAGAADVIQAVNLARDTGLELAVKGGGHNIAGKATCDGGPPARPVGHALGAGRRGEEDRARRARRAALGLRSRDAGVRPVDSDGHQLDDRHGGPDAGRRLRLAEPPARAHHRQPGLGRRRAGERRAGRRLGQEERGPVLGDPRRRRQLRRRHVVRVPAAQARSRRAGRARRLPDRAGGRRASPATAPSPRARPTR